MQLVTSYIFNDIIWVSCSSKVITAVLSSKHCGEFVIGLTQNVTGNEKERNYNSEWDDGSACRLVLSVQINRREQMIHFSWLFLLLN